MAFLVSPPSKPKKRYEKRSKYNKKPPILSKIYRKSEIDEANDPFIDKVSRLCNIMEETFEANSHEGHVKEWIVEFIAMVNGEKHHHLSVLYGMDQEDVQRAMLHELRRIYTDTERIDVTIIRLEEIESENDTFFEGLFIP